MAEIGKLNLSSIFKRQYPMLKNAKYFFPIDIVTKDGKVKIQRGDSMPAAELYYHMLKDWSTKAERNKLFKHLSYNSREALEAMIDKFSTDVQHAQLVQDKDPRRGDRYTMFQNEDSVEAGGYPQMLYRDLKHEEPVGLTHVKAFRSEEPGDLRAYHSFLTPDDKPYEPGRKYVHNLDEPMDRGPDARPPVPGYSAGEASPEGQDEVFQYAGVHKLIQRALTDMFNKERPDRALDYPEWTARARPIEIRKVFGNPVDPENRIEHWTGHHYLEDMTISDDPKDIKRYTQEDIYKLADKIADRINNKNFDEQYKLGNTTVRQKMLEKMLDSISNDLQKYVDAYNERTKAQASPDHEPRTITLEEMLNYLRMNKNGSASWLGKDADRLIASYDFINNAIADLYNKRAMANESVKRFVHTVDPDAYEMVHLKDPEFPSDDELLVRVTDAIRTPFLKDALKGGVSDENMKENISG